MNLHILPDSIYSSKFIDFVNQNFSSSNHIFVAFNSEPKYIERSKIKVIDIDNPGQLIWLHKKISNADKVFLHGLFHIKETFLISLLNKKFFSKTFWVIWGGDLYYFWIKDSHTFKEIILEKMKKYTIKNIKGIISLVEEDYLFAKEKYKINAKYLYAFYPNPVNFSILDFTQDDLSDSKEKVLLVGNSASPTNNHFKILDALYKYKMDNIKIICPLSYGPQEYANQVQKYGEKLFGDKFIALRNFLSEKEYAKILSSIDVAIFAHKRQQALGNILALLYLGKKVYIRSDISSWKFFQRLGVKVFETQKILDGSETNIFSLDEEAAIKNRKIIFDEFSEERCVQLWKKVFEYKE